MKKYVHGRVRLATASPRVGEYDYGTKTYEPADYYGDHFMYRDDPNLLPVKKGLYASFSPYPGQNALTAFPPQTLYSPHSKSYSQNWSPMSGVCKPCSMGYLGNTGESSYGSDEEVLAMLESGEIEPMNQEDAGFIGGLLGFLGDVWGALTGWWDSLSEEEKQYYREQAAEAVASGVASATGDADDTSIKDPLMGIGISLLNDEALKEAYQKIKANQAPYSKTLLGNEYYAIRSAILQEMIRRKLLTLTLVMVPGGLSLTPPKASSVQSVFCKAFPNDPKCQPKSTGSGSGDKKGGVGALVLGAGALALLAKVLL